MTTKDTNTDAQQSKDHVPALSDFLAAVTDENLHPEVGTGEPVGEEVMQPAYDFKGQKGVQGTELE